MSPHVAHLSPIDSNPRQRRLILIGWVFPLAGVACLRHCFVARAPGARYLLFLVGVVVCALWGDREDDSR